MTQTRRTINRARLKEIRLDAGLSLDQLAEAMKRDAIRRGYVRASNKGASGAYLSGIETGRVTPSAIYLRRLADTLGVDLDAISTREPIDRAA
jgi:transcriptional regulator with XRE-family HTH domain